MACGVIAATGRAAACSDSRLVTNPAASANKVFKCHGAKDSPAWLSAGPIGDLDLKARMLLVDSDAFPINDVDLRVLVEPTAAWDATTGNASAFSCSL